jgi:hypothetical protein
LHLDGCGSFVVEAEKGRYRSDAERRRFVISCGGS